MQICSLTTKVTAYFCIKSALLDFNSLMSLWGNPVVSTRLCCSRTSCNFDIFEYFDVVFHNDQGFHSIVSNLYHSYYSWVYVMKSMLVSKIKDAFNLSECIEGKILLEQAWCISLNIIYGSVFRRPCKVVIL